MDGCRLSTRMFMQLDLSPYSLLLERGPGFLSRPRVTSPYVTFVTFQGRLHDSLEIFATLDADMVFYPVYSSMKR